MVLKRTPLPNALVSLGIQLQHAARSRCGYGEELVVLARGYRIVVNLGTRSVHYPFLLRLPAGQLPKARGSFPDIDQVGDQLKLLFNQQELGKQQQRQGGGQQQKQGEQQQQQQPQQQQQQQQQGGQHEQRCQKVSALTPTERKATWTSPPAGQDHGDPAGPDKSQEGACGRAPTRASALAAGWLK